MFKIFLILFKIFQKQIFKRKIINKQQQDQLLIDKFTVLILFIQSIILTYLNLKKIVFKILEKILEIKCQRNKSTNFFRYIPIKQNYYHEGYQLNCDFSKILRIEVKILKKLFYDQEATQEMRQQITHQKHSIIIESRTQQNLFISSLQRISVQQRERWIIMIIEDIFKQKQYTLFRFIIICGKFWNIILREQSVFIICENNTQIKKKYENLQYVPLINLIKKQVQENIVVVQGQIQSIQPTQIEEAFIFYNKFKSFSYKEVKENNLQVSGLQKTLQIQINLRDASLEGTNNIIQLLIFDNSSFFPFTLVWDNIEYMQNEYEKLMEKLIFEDDQAHDFVIEVLESAESIIYRVIDTKIIY